MIWGSWRDVERDRLIFRGCTDWLLLSSALLSFANTVVDSAGRSAKTASMAGSIPSDSPVRIRLIRLSSTAVSLLEAAASSSSEVSGSGWLRFLPTILVAFLEVAVAVPLRFGCFFCTGALGETDRVCDRNTRELFVIGGDVERDSGTWVGESDSVSR